MPVVTTYDGSGRPIDLGRKLGAGGEGTVLEVVDQPGAVAKVYHEPVSPSKAAKLRCMVRMGDAKLTQFAAWPQNTLHRSKEGPIVGLLLPKIESSAPIHELYSPAARRLRFPDADWQFLLRVARNCAAAFSTLHERGIVVGDVNQGNVLVASDAMVRLIDCDSFQVVDGKEVYGCEVGVPHFTPPELQGVNFRDVTRSESHDCFGLAVLVFHLLFMGRHPFAGRFEGAGEMPIEKAIREYRFSFSQRSDGSMSPPPFSMPLSCLPPRIAQLFEVAFAQTTAEKPRPAARLWVGFLNELEKHLAACRLDQGHKYWTQLRKCPWCEILDAGGPNFFESVAAGKTVAEAPRAFNVEGIWRDIQNVPPPPEEWKAEWPEGFCITPTLPPPPSSDLLLLRKLVTGIAFGGAALCLFGLAAPGVLFFTIPVSVAFGAWRVLLEVGSHTARIRRQRKGLLRTKESALREAQQLWRDTAAQLGVEFRERLTELARCVEDYNSLSARVRAELDQLQNNLEQAQRTAYLRQQMIRAEARNIAHLDETLLTVLESYGIETAFDIEVDKLQQVPQISETVAVALWAWRRGVESRFSFNPSQGIPASETRAVKLRMRRVQARLEDRLSQGATELWQLREQGNKRLAPIESDIGRGQFEVVQADADLRILELSRPQKKWLGLLLLMSVIFPVILGLTLTIIEYYF